MTPETFVSLVLDPGLATLRTVGIPSDDRARLLILAICGQESNWEHRRQIGGPARGFAQFERGGGVRGVLTHSASHAAIRRVCGLLDIPCDEATVYEAAAWNDTLAVALARLLLWTDPRPLPARGDEHGAWVYYLRLWRPGKPHPDAWPRRYQQALEATQ